MTNDQRADRKVALQQLAFVGFVFVAFMAALWVTRGGLPNM